MNEEIKFYSIGRGNLNIDGKFYYGLDYAITDFMRDLEQENQQLKDRINKAVKKLNGLDFDKFVYGKTALKDTKRDLLDLLKGDKE